MQVMGNKYLSYGCIPGVGEERTELKESWERCAALEKEPTSEANARSWAADLGRGAGDWVERRSESEGSVGQSGNCWACGTKGC